MGDDNSNNRQPIQSFVQYNISVSQAECCKALNATLQIFSILLRLFWDATGTRTQLSQLGAVLIERLRGVPLHLAL